MQVINHFRLRDFWADHRRSESSLRGWYQLVCSHDWDSPEALQGTFPYAQHHEGLTAFDIRGSSFFVVTSTDFAHRHIYVREVLLHNEFRTGDWKHLAGSGDAEIEPDDRSYDELVSSFPLRPVHDEDLLRQAAARIDALISKRSRSHDEQDYLEVLSLIVRDYEWRDAPIPPVSGAEVLRALISEHRLSQAELIPLLGGKAKVTPVLQGTRPLDLRQVVRASRYFKLPPETFMDPDDFEDVTEPGKRSRT